MKKIRPSLQVVLFSIACLAYTDQLQSQHCKVIVQAVPDFCNPNIPCIPLTALPWGTDQNPPYTYAWSTNETTETICVPNQSAFIMVTVTDNVGCTAVANLSISGPITEWAFLNQTCTNCCPGDPMDLGVQWTFSEPPGFTYLWSTGETSPGILTTTPGTYTVTLTDESTGCTLVLSETLAYPPAPDPVIVGPTSLCSGQSATLSVTGGPYDGYQWLPSGEYTPTIEVTEPGTYVVVVSQSGFSCAGIDTLEILPGSGSPPPLQLSGPTNLCSGQSGTIEVINAGDYSSFIWNTGQNTSSITINTPGTYTVTATDAGGCGTVTASFTVAGGNGISSISGVITGSTSCSNPNGSVNITVSPPGAYTFLWSNNATTEDIYNVAAGSYSVTVTSAAGCTGMASYTLSLNVTPPVINVAIASTTCGLSNGSVNLTITPAGPYTFIWSNNATTEDIINISAGDYLVTITSGSNGCTSTTIGHVININPPINISGSSTPVTACTSANGVIDITPAPTGNYTFMWSNNATTEDIANLPAGTYTVTVSGNGTCTGTAGFTVGTNISPPVVNTTITGATCGLNNGAINLNISPAGPYNFVWSNNATTEDLNGVPAGNYAVTVTNAGTGCTATATAVVTNTNQPVSVSGFATPVNSCVAVNGAIDITPAPSGSYNFTWSNNATTEDLTNIAAGTYTVTVSAGGSCTATASFTVANNTQVPGTNTDITGATCGFSNGAVNLDVTPPDDYTFLWSNNTTSEDLNGVPAGNYAVTVTAIATGCTATATAVVPNTSAPVNISGNATPVTSCTAANGAINITPSPTGTYTFAWSNSANTEDIANLAAGNYTVTLTASGNCTTTASFSVASNAPAPNTSSNITGTTCDLSNGAVNLDVIPAGAYTFLWSNNATTEDLSAIAAGNYSVTVTDVATGCTAMASATVSNTNPPVNVSGNATPVSSCTTANGAIDITPSPASSYTFAWSNNAGTEDLNNLVAGNYTVTVTAAGTCAATAVFNVASNTPVIGTGSSSIGTTCDLSNGAVNLDVTPAGNYTFFWSNNATTEDLSAIAAGNYSVTVTDVTTGCTATAAATVPNTNPPIGISGNSTPVTTCTAANGAIDITPSPAGSYTFAWSNSASTEDLSNLAAGTYTVTVTAAGTCTATAGFTVASNTPAPNPTSSSTETTCNLSNGAVNLDVTPAGTYTFLWSNNATTEDLSAIAAGNYTVTVSDVATGCTATASATVPNTNPPIGITGNSTPLTSCTTANGAIDITPSPTGTYTFAWSNSASTEDLANLAAGTYTVTVTAAGTCTATAGFTVASNTPAPNATSSSTETTCNLSNGAVNLDVTPAGTYTFLWSNNATTEDLSAIAAGNYSVTITATGTGCTATASATVPNTNPPIGITGNSTPLTSCTAANGAIDITPAPAGSYTFAWSNSASAEDLANLAAGTYTVTVTAAGSCTATAGFTVANNTPAPNATSSSTETTCNLSNGAVNLDVTPTGSYTFLWSNNATTEDLSAIAAGNYTVTVSDVATGCTATASATVPNTNPPIGITGNSTPLTSCTTANGAIDITPSPAGSYNFAWSNNASTEDLANLAAGAYTVTVTAAGTCTATAGFTVASNTPAPNATSSSIETTCGLSNGAVNLDVTPAGTYTFLWSNNATTEDLSAIAAGNYSVTITATGTGCTATASATVPNTNPPIGITGNSTPLTSCTAANGAIDITPSPAGSYTFTWSNNASTEDLTNLAAGNYSVTVTAAGTCTATAGFTVASNTPAPSTGSNITGTTCGFSNGAVNLDVTPAGAYTFLWSNNATTEDLSTIAAGNYSVTITATGTGCTATASATVPGLGTAFTLSGSPEPSSSCILPNGAINLTATPVGAYSFQWSNGAGLEDISGLVAGTYLVTATDNLGCTATASFVISDMATPPQVQVTLHEPLCDGTAGWVEVHPVPGSNEPLEYSIDNGATFTASNILEGLPAGQNMLIARDVNGCTVSASIFVPNPVFPLLFVEPEVVLEWGEQHQIHVLLSGLALNQIDSVMWSPTAGLTFEGSSTLQLLNPVAQPVESTVYTVTVLSSAGCEVSASINFRVSDEYHIYVPNVIRPDNPDGDNHTFYIFTQPGTVREVKSLQVYDRWGNQVFSNQHFEPDNAQMGWKGDYRGKPMSPAVFVWWAEVELPDGRMLILKGNVTVVR